MKKLGTYRNDWTEFTHKLGTDIDVTRSIFRKSVTMQNYIALLFAAIPCIFIEIYNISGVFASDSGLGTLNNRVYFTFYLLLLMAAIFTCVIQGLLRSNARLLYRVQMYIVVFYLVWNALFNSYQVHKKHQITLLIFITALMGAMVIVRLTLRDSILIIILSSSFAIGLTSPYLGPSQTTNTLISIIVTLLAVFVLYLQKVSALAHQLDVDNMNVLLQREKEQLRMNLEKQMLIMKELNLLYLEYNLAEDLLVFSKQCAQQFHCPTHIHYPSFWFEQSDLIHESDYGNLGRLLRTHAQTKQHAEMELRIKEHNETYTWYRLRLDAQCNDAGELISSIGSFQNLAEITHLHERLNQRIAKQMEESKNYLDYLKATQQKVLLYHHDMRHSLKLMEQMIAQGDLDALRSHSLLAQEELEAITPRYFCENDTINLILGSFEQMAEKELVEFSYRVSLPSHLPFSNLTLCTLFFNLLENALFATSKVKQLDQRFIKIESYINNNKLILNIRNSFTGTLHIEDDLPVPDMSKKVDGTHGFGISSIVTTVNEHDGMYLFRAEGQVFIAQLILPLIEERNTI